MSILRSTRTGLTAAAEAQRLRVAVGALEQSISAAQMFPANSRHYGFVADFDKDSTALSFVARLPASFPRAGRFGDLVVRRVTFNTEPDPDSFGSRLLLRQTPLLLEPDRDEEENPLILAREVADFQLEFWGRNATDWTDSWLSTNQLPRLVRFTLSFFHPGRRDVDPARTIVRVVALSAADAPGNMPPYTPQPGDANRPPTNAPPPRTSPPAAGGGRSRTP
jgi:hypothetical protein